MPEKGQQNPHSRQNRPPRADGRKTLFLNPEEPRRPESAASRTTPMARVLMSAIGRMESAGRIRESLALAYWPRVVGAQGAAATRAETVRDGILIIRTRSSSWSHELNLHKARLIQNLNRALGGAIIKEIYFRAQGVEDEQQEPAAAEPAGEELAAVSLDAGERASLRASLQELFEYVSDDTVRSRIARRMSDEARLRHWRMEHGWRACARCGCPHTDPRDICPVCRLCA